MPSTEPPTSADQLAVLTAEAEAALARQDWPAAAASYEELVAKQPKNSEHRFNLVRAYDELGRADEALKVLQHASIAHLDKTKRRLARTYIDLKDYAAAIPLVDELVAAHPDNPKFANWKAVLDEKSDPDPVVAERMQRGQELLDSGRLDEAEQLFVELLASIPGLPRASLSLGKLYAQQKRWGEAIPPLRAGLTAEPSNRKLKNTLARALFKDGQARAAIAVVESGDGPGQHVDSLFLLQRCHLELHNWKMAHDVGGRLLKLLPADDPLRPRVEALNDEAAVRNALAGLAAATDPSNPKSVEVAYRDVAERHPGSPLPWLAFGTVLAGSSRHEEAAAVLHEARAAHPANLDIRTALSRAVINSGNDQVTLRHAREAARDHGGDFEAFRWLARYHADREEWEETIEPARRALAFEPQNAATRVALVHALLHLGRLAEALDELAPLLASGEKQVEALQLKGDILFRLARLNDALGAYAQGAELAPKDPVLARSLAEAFLLSGEVEEFHSWHVRRRERPGSPEISEWDGELSLDGKLLVWADASDSLGEQVLYLRFLNQLVALGFEPVAEVDASLVDICRCSFPQVTAIVRGSELPAAIVRQTALTGLFRWFKPDLQSLRSEQPYLIADAEAVQAERARLSGAAGEDRLVVGVDWPSTDLPEAIASSRIELVDLRSEGLTADRLAALDLLVCGDGHAAHLAGAMGIPAMVILPPLPCPYWLAAGMRCVWYPSARLIRQAPIDDGWSVAIVETAVAVEQFVCGPDLRRSEPQGLKLSPIELAEAARCFIAQGPQHYPAYRSALELIERIPGDQLSRQLSLDKAALLVRFGEWQAARAILESMRPSGQTDPEIERLVLAVCLAMYDLDAALPTARALAADDPAFKVTAANILFQEGRNEEALAELRAVSVVAPDVESVSSLFGTLLLETGQPERAAAYLVDQAPASRSAADYALLGRAVADLGRHDDAQAAFDMAIAASPEDPAANFWRTRERVASGATQRTSLAAMEGETPDVSRDDLVIMFVADSGYFWEHALVLLGSIARHSPGAKCHVHVVNPDANIAAAVDLARKSLPGLSYSRECVEFKSCSQAHVRTYYASIRFVRLAELLERAPATYLCIDSDCIVRGDVTAAPLEVGEVGIRMRYSDRPHMTVAAGALVLRPTPGAASFIGRVAELISEVLESGESAWFLDQVVLSCVVREARARGIAVTQLGMEWIDWFFGDSSLIWTGKGPRKSDARYMRELAPYRFLQLDESMRAQMPPGIS